MKTQAFVIGHPIKHSRSPLIHSYWRAKYRCEGSYEKFDIAPDELRAFVQRLRTGVFVGGNVTLPHKPHILHLCDRLSAAAGSIGAVNTLYFENQTLVGHNSDAVGFTGNLDQLAPGWDQSLHHVVVLGAGGAARAILYALIERGAKKITIINRTVHNALELAQHFGERVEVDDYNNVNTRLKTADLLVNSSSIGLNGTSFDNVDLSQLPQSALVTDIVYTPLVTPLLRDAAALGLRTIDGLGMLLHQAAPGFEKWFGINPLVDDKLRQLVEADLVAGNKVASDV